MSENSIDAAETPGGIDHLVLHVRDLDESHRFWTECLGFKHVGTMRRQADGGAPPPTRFYSGERDGKLSHHDVALVEQPTLAAYRGAREIDHIAISYPSKAAWERQVHHLARRGVPLFRKLRRGTTDSVHARDPNGYVIELVVELPREMWEQDIDAALNKPPIDLV